MSIVIRTATPADAPLLAALGARTFTETYAAHNTPEDMAQYETTHFRTEVLLQEMAHPEASFFLAFAGREAVGYAKLGNARQPAELVGQRAVQLERIYVLEAHQRGWVGYRLIRHCMEEAVRRGAGVLWLGVWQRNRRAIRFYERLGFVIFGEEIFQLGSDAQADHLMKLEL